MLRSLKSTGIFVLNIKENVFNGQRHPYVFDLVKDLQHNGWNWTETYIWKKNNSYPIKPIKRLKDQFEYLFHFTKGDDFQFFPEKVMVDAKDDTCRRYQRAVNTMAKRGSKTFVNNDRYHYYRHDARKLAGQCKDGALKVFPSNVISASIGTNRAFKGVQHPSMFPRKLPEFFVDLFTKPGDLVVDPFTGSGTTNIVAKEKCRRTIGFDIKKEYVDVANERLNDVKCEVQEP
jgi:DNA modification methylase